MRPPGRPSRHGEVELARSLGLDITAEGIETAAQLTRSRALGCDRGQGFLMAQSLATEAINILLAHPVKMLPPAGDCQSAA